MLTGQIGKIVFLFWQAAATPDTPLKLLRQRQKTVLNASLTLQTSKLEWLSLVTLS
jgi:hypothetical protein